jgi:hypothetical protein
MRGGEVGQGKAPSEYWNYLKLQLQRLKERWLAYQSQLAGANFAPANPAQTKETK